MAGSDDEEVYLSGNEVADGFGGKGDGAWIKQRGPLSRSEDGIHFGWPRFPEGLEGAQDDKYGLFPLGAVSVRGDATLVLFGKLRFRQASEYVFCQYDSQGYRQVSRIPLPAETDGQALLAAQMASDRSGRFGNRLYVAFVSGEDHEDVVKLAVSDDEGLHWETRTIARGSAKDFGEHRSKFAAVAVDRTGVVGMEWQLPGDCPVFGVSLDGGNSVNAKMTLGNCRERGDLDRQPNLAESLLWPLGGSSGFSFFVETDSPAGVQIVSDTAGRFHTFWIEGREDGQLALKSQTIRVQGEAAASEEPLDLARAVDLSKSSLVKLSDVRFDPYTGTFELNARVQNKNPQKAMPYPSFLEVVDSSSDCGTVSYLNPFSKSQKGTPRFRIAKKPDTSRLYPGESSLPTHLVVQVTGCENRSGELVRLARNRWKAGRQATVPLRVHLRALATD